MALEEAIKWIQTEGFTECTFKTDCQTLSIAANDLQPPTGMDWRAFTEVFNVCKAFKEMPGFQCLYVPRGQNVLADYLANKGRLERWDYRVLMIPLFLITIVLARGS